MKKFAVLFAGATLVVGTLFYRTEHPTNLPHLKPRIVIVGAGIAGLAAAKHLQEHADATVTIFEARDRIGGRISLDHSLGVPMPLGATWIHHVEGNPLYHLCQQRAIPTQPADWTDSAIYDRSGHRLDSEEASQFWGGREDFLQAMDGSELGSATTIKQVFREVKQQRPTNACAVAGSRWSYRWEYELENGADAETISSFYSPNDICYAGIDHLVAGNFSQLLEFLSDHLDIRFREIVRRIEYGEEGVALYTNRGIHEADYVIVTLPLGVLKARSVEFSPSLPKEKKDAIGRIGLGDLAKIMLRFTERFWPGEPQYLIYAPEKSTRFPMWVNWHKNLGAPVLSTEAGGGFARAVEHMEPEETAHQAMTILRNMFGPEIPNPTGVVVTSWTSDPYAEGAYSYLRAGCSKEDFDILAEPVPPLFFAGEATHGESYATVDGAYLSGIREGKRLQAILEEASR